MQERLVRLFSKPFKKYSGKSRVPNKLLISVYFFLFPFISILSQSDSLNKYLEIAIKNNPEVLQRFYEYQAALQKIPQVGTISDPQLSFGVFLKPMEIAGGNRVADITLMQMFPWFGVLRNARDEMNLMANAKFEIFRDAKLQVIYDVQRTWYELFKIQESIAASEKNLEILKTIERLSLVSFKSGPSVNNASTRSSSSTLSTYSQSSISPGSAGMQSMGGSQISSGNINNSQPSAPMQSGSMSPSGALGLADLYRIQMESGELENNIAQMKDQANIIVSRFNEYLNRKAFTPVFTDDIITSDSLSNLTLMLPDSVSAKNPMLFMIEYEKKSLDARKEMVKAMGYPMLGFGLNYSVISRNEMSTSAMNGEDMIMPMVTLTLPVYRKKYKAMQLEADLLNRAATNNYQATANFLQTEYYKAIQLYQDSQRRLKLYKNQYQLASKSLDLILKSFSVSGSDLSDVLRVRQQTLDYELKKIEAVADLNIAIAWLKRLGNIE